MGTLLFEVPGMQIGDSFFEVELKLAAKDSADPTQHEFQHPIVWSSQEGSISKHKRMELLPLYHQLVWEAVSV